MHAEGFKDIEKGEGGLNLKAKELCWWGKWCGFWCGGWGIYTELSLRKNNLGKVVRSCEEVEGLICVRELIIEEKTIPSKETRPTRQKP